MLIPVRSGAVASIGVAFLVTFVLASCATGVADSSAVQIGSRSIRQAAIAHRMLVIAGEGSKAAGEPSPPVPDPPHYRVCLSFRRKYPSVFDTDPVGARAGKLLAECKSEFQKLKLKALYYLTSIAWVEGEASELRVKASNAEIQQELAQVVAQAPSEALVRHLLVGSRGTTKDLYQSIKLTLLIKKIQQKLEAGMRQLTTAQRQQALERFGAQFKRRWMARTVCSREDLVPMCRNFRAPGVGAEFVPPEIPLTNLTATES